MNKIPDLEDRFLPPNGWRPHHFKSHGMRIAFGSAFPENEVPDAVVVCLPGLSEFTEKYYEVARTCLDMKLAFWVLDWPGQGRSDRYLKDPHKRHGENFDIDVERLHAFILGYIKHSSVHPDKGRIPLAMLGHSMGANIGLRYLSKYPDVFECAAFTSPMLGIKALNKIPLSNILLNALDGARPEHYVMGGGEWNKAIRRKRGLSVFSHDEKRNAIHEKWCEADPALAVGSPTFRWLYYASQSCNFVQKKDFLDTVETKCLITIAGKDMIVDNEDIKRAANNLKNAELIEFKDAGHEILMEIDEIRDSFFTKFHKLIEKTIIQRPETLKPF